MAKKNIHQVFDLKMKDSCPVDRSRLHRILVLLKEDCKTLKENNSERLYLIFRNYYKNKIEKESLYFKDKKLITYTKNKCLTSLRAERYRIFK